MSEHQLAIREAQAIARGFDDDTRELIRKTVSDPRQPLSTDEFNLFIAVCQHTGLNPLLKEIYATKIDGRFTILTGIDGYRKMAQSSRRFRGMAGPFWCGQDGVWRDAWLDQTPPTACKVGVYVPGVPEPTWGVAYFKNYRTRNTPTWKQMPEHMLAVRAEAFALRKVFGREIGAVALPADDEQWDQAPALEQPDPGPSPRMAALRADLESIDDDAIEDALDAAVDQAVTQHEQEQPPAEADPVTEQTKLACAAFVDEVKAANPKIKIALPAEGPGQGDAFWRAWLDEKRAAWATSEHNPANRS